MLTALHVWIGWTHGVRNAAGWQTAAYAIVRICNSEATNLVNTVAPGFLDKHGLKVGGRDAKADDGETLHVGVEVLLSRTVTLSGAHYDSTPAVLIPITGTRTVWWAPKATLESRSSRHPGEERAVRRELHPADGGPTDGWLEESEIGPGEAVCLPRGDWHSVRGEPSSIALSVSG